MTRRRKKRAKTNTTGESRGAEWLTIAWMLSVVTTLVCEFGSVGARWCASLLADRPLLGVLSEILLFAAMVIGMISLVMTPAVIKIRRARPPRGILVFAVAVAAAPVLVVFLRLMN